MTASRKSFHGRVCRSYEKDFEQTNPILEADKSQVATARPTGLLFATRGLKNVRRDMIHVEIRDALLETAGVPGVGFFYDVITCTLLRLDGQKPGNPVTLWNKAFLLNRLQIASIPRYHGLSRFLA